MERLTFLVLAIIAVLIAVRLDLSYVGLAILLGIAFPVASLVCGSDMSRTTLSGHALVVIGLALLLIAYLVCNHYGISLDQLDHDRSFPKPVRRLPYFGIVILSSGLTSIAISALCQREE